MFDNSNILVVVAHPDDEWWGSGGTLLRLRKEFSNSISICYVSSGERHDRASAGRRKNAIDLCLKDLEIESPKVLGFNDMTIYKNIEKLTFTLDKLISKVSPDIIFTHFPYDFHQDHKAVYDCVKSATRIDPSISIFCMETPFKYNFSSNFYVDISGYVAEKVRTWVKTYARESMRRKEYNPEYIRRMASFRGLEIGVDHAEAFIIERGVLK